MTRILLFAALIPLLAASCQKPAAAPGDLKFVHHVKNEGPKPKEGDFIFYQVEMTNGDSLLYSSFSEPDMPVLPVPSPGSRFRFPWMESLLLMSPGDSLSVYIPADSLRQMGVPGFEKAEFAVYRLAVKEIKSGIREGTLAFLENNESGNPDERLQKTASGLQYLILEEGTGAAAVTGQMVTCHYYGVLPDGRMFESSFFTGKPASFPLGMGQVIQGWDEAFALLQPGARVFLYVPYDLAYGERPRPGIPARSDLVFYIEYLRAE